MDKEKVKIDQIANTSQADSVFTALVKYVNQCKDAYLNSKISPSKQKELVVKAKEDFNVKVGDCLDWNSLSPSEALFLGFSKGKYGYAIPFYFHSCIPDGLQLNSFFDGKPVIKHGDNIDNDIRGGYIAYCVDCQGNTSVKANITGAAKEVMHAAVQFTCIAEYPWSAKYCQEIGEIAAVRFMIHGQEFVRESKSSIDASQKQKNREALTKKANEKFAKAMNKKPKEKKPEKTIKR